MIDLFGAAGLAALDALARRRALYAFDFDGTLAPIVDHPAAARAEASTLDLLRALGRHVPVVLLTGRAVDDLRQRIDFAPSYLIGNHGAEGLPGGHDDAHESQRAAVRGWLAQWAAAIAHEPLAAGDEGRIAVEAKAFSLSIHYRAAFDQDAARRAIANAVARLEPAPRVVGGKCVVNLLPEGAPDKGLALRALVGFENAESAFFVGDDVTDESVFVGAPDDWVTVRVGPTSDSAARYAIDGQGDIDRCLRVVIASIENARAAR